MAAIQLSFSLRTTSNVKQVHLIGSWDGYQGQLPLSRESGSKWKGTFRFQPSVMESGKRYWFYYMLDGYQVTHDPSKEYTVEPTTSRKLNVLDVPASATKHSRTKSSSESQHASKRSSRRHSREIPRGRPTNEIASPTPVRPGHLARKLEAAARTQSTMDALSQRLEASRLAEYDSDSDIDDDSDSDADSDVPSLTSAGSSVSGCSSPSSVSSSSSNCTCERYGITRHGQRVKLDCGGSRCGSDEESDICSSEEEYTYSKKQQVRPSRRHGVVIRWTTKDYDNTMMIYTYLISTNQLSFMLINTLILWHTRHVHEEHELLMSDVICPAGLVSLWRWLASGLNLFHSDAIYTGLLPSLGNIRSSLCLFDFCQGDGEPCDHNCGTEGGWFFQRLFSKPWMNVRL